MGGHYGVDRITVKGLKVVAADVEKNVVLVRGSIPGAKNGIVRIEKQSK
jgi:large subunit ribosomal protein L3